MVWPWSGDVHVSSDSYPCNWKQNVPSLPLEFLRPT